ncbi:flavodoxin domain-containing protein [Streptomyces sp. NBC_01304]|uniref:flavodoxin domain-containing protein n=1 Tax=Streptomyces sp. NBC_01304 TaxID=2903818 RepID=UPI002E15EF62|nr:flavodoxin domain-containing protein [Streptomyces sp. NBC_01304]
MARTVLVTYGTKYGATADIARSIGDALRGHDCTVEVRPADEVRDLGTYNAVILGGALYAGRWHRDARRFARRHGKALERVPVWLFSSGPLDDSAPGRPPTAQVRRLIRRLDARGHRTFGGRLDDTARGRMARMIVDSGKGGDFRDTSAITSWAQDIARELPQDTKS